ncbi:hypothetical protein SCFA_280017 [anaerobic digester metagenome]|uniref:Uncharacterized protein n=1 Tax=anaerobic digester metagenome TaxID=1263854 RepID=A0A485M5C2_9ZZZZ
MPFQRQTGPSGVSQAVQRVANKPRGSSHPGMIQVELWPVSVRSPKGIDDHVHEACHVEGPPISMHKRQAHPMKIKKEKTQQP